MGWILSRVLLGKGSAPDRPIFCDALMPRWGAGTEFRMIRWGDYKYVRFRQAPPFDLRNDPGEQKNLLVCNTDEQTRHILQEMAALAEDSIDSDLVL